MSEEKKKRIGDLYGSLNSDKLMDDMKRFQEEMKKITPPLASMFTFVMNANAKYQFDRTVREKQLRFDSDIRSVISNNVPDDTVWMVESIANAYSKPINLPSDWDEQMDALKRRIMDDMERTWMYGAFADFAEPTVKPFAWRRLEYESLLSWGDRLVAAGVMDVPEVRWAYQQAVMRAPFVWLRGKFRKWVMR